MLIARAEVGDPDLRDAVLERDEGEAPALRRQARGQDARAAGGHISVIVAVAVHDRDSLDPRIGRPGLRDIGNAGIEHAGRSSDRLVGEAGTFVRGAPQVVRSRDEADPGKLAPLSTS